ncbi:amino acid synthesis family protein [Labrys sp. ZIDIC5]|uniref:amino acid synthesis family protein n=1 Tax=Labrys sedimenti TaxID=3106036 RepID=UPI002ACA61F4|nr:amino acid synthesis family protein [Labrys sp. ZIDIC5]MDZ5453768.1 amino acid synthesis family protein [Labrys sp. ZIDIC5]
MSLEIRKIVRHAEEVFIEGGKTGPRPILASAVAAIIKNPWEGLGFVEDLRPVVLDVAPKLAGVLVPRLLELCPKDRIEAYGKSAIVGLAGEIEHGSALIHTLRFGNVFREAAGGTSYLSFTNTRGPAGAQVSLPMTHKTIVGQRSHFITLNFSVSDAPDRGEILIAIGAADSGRMHPRIGDRFKDMEEMGITPPKS